MQSIIGVPAGRGIASKFVTIFLGVAMLVSILLIAFIILGLFLSMLSSHPRSDPEETVTLLPHPGEKLPQEPAEEEAETTLILPDTVHT